MEKTVKEKKAASKEVNFSNKRVSIRQYIDPEIMNLGLENNNMSVFFGENGNGGHKEWIGYKQIGDTRVYMTGLEKSSENVKKIKDPSERDSMLEELKNIKAYLESFYGEGVLDSTNRSFWNEIFIEVRVPIFELDLTKPEHVLLYYGIKGEGFSEIAPSFEFAKQSNKIYKFYLHEDEEVMNVKTEITKLRNKAKTFLQNLYEEDSTKMFYMAKVLLPITKGYKHSTVLDILYQELDDFISGVSVKTNLKETPTKFINLYKEEKSNIIQKAIIEEALYQRFIIKNAENVFVNISTAAEYGKSKEAIFAYFSNPIHADELLEITEKVNKVWGK